MDVGLIIMRYYVHIFVLCAGMKVKCADVLIDVNDIIPICFTLILTSQSQSWLLVIFCYQGFAKKLFFLRIPMYPYLTNLHAHGF